MATISQICQFMNERKLEWYPQYVCDIEPVRLGELVFGCFEIDMAGVLYKREDNQKFIGHFFKFDNRNGNQFSSIMLLPLNNSKYLKVKVV